MVKGYDRGLGEVRFVPSGERPRLGAVGNMYYYVGIGRDRLEGAEPQAG